jgi:hypothetical protein
LLSAFVCAAVQSQGVVNRGAVPEPKAAFSGKPFRPKFTDVTVPAGLKATLTVGNPNSKRYIIEANGAGAAFIDYDHDGWLDIFLVNGSRLEGFPKGQESHSYLFRNDKKGSFTDVTSEAGVMRTGWGSGVCAGDYDNDGNTDLYVTYWGPNALFQNRAGKFVEVSERAGVQGPLKEWSSGCTFLDYDRDGFLDLFVTSYQDFDPARTPLPGKGANCEWKGVPVFCGPRGLPYGTATLYRNRGDGTFEDTSIKSGIRKAKGFYAFTPVAADLNQDGWTDLYVASDSTPSLFFRNNKDGTFGELATETGLAFNEHGHEQGGMGIAVGDIDGDGMLDVIKTNFAGDYPNVYRNQGGGIFEDEVVKAGLAVNPQYVGWGIGLIDLDNDGRQDVFQVNGHVYPEIDRAKIGETYRNPRIVYRNLGGGRFEDVSHLAGAGVSAIASSRGAAFGDFDNDGDIDVIVMNMGEAPSLLRNDLPGGAHWVQFRLRGTKSNRTGIGAIVTVRAAAKQQSLPLLSQSSFLSQNDFRLHFGLGAAEKVDQVTVQWPNGLTEQFEVAIDKVSELVEGSGSPQ